MLYESLNRWSVALNDETASCHGHEAHTHQLRSDEVVSRAAEMFAALGDPSRLRLMELLQTERHCVSELAVETGASMSAVSQRLKLLTHARLVTRTREGKHVYYALADDHVRRILHEVLEHADE
jgi:ArsR family transcriptional regulator